MTQEDSSGSRRRFFHESLARLAGPLADYLESHLPPSPAFLRPPGAIGESEFSDTCHRCGKCVEACPADAIFALARPGSAADGTPVVDPNRAACVICEGHKCTHVCPSGALLPVFDASLIGMGTAVVHDAVCVRSQNQHCTYCVDLCPLGERAIRFESSGPPRVLAEGCVGCGVCQYNCPTEPKAIVVRPVESI